MSLTPTSPFAGEGPDFNQGEAELVYRQLMGMDADSAQVYGRMLVGAALQNDLFVHEQEITTAVAKALDERTAQLHRNLVRTSIAKARAGQDNTGELEALVEISKAGLFSHGFLSDKARKQKKDPVTGRFQVMHEAIVIPRDAEYIPGRYAGRIGNGIPELDQLLPDNGLSSEQKTTFQHGYLQIERMMAPWVRTPDKGAIATVHYADGGQPTNFSIPKSGKVPVIGEAVKLKDGTESTAKRGLDPARRPVALTVETMPEQSAGGGIMAALNALGFPKLGSLAGGATEDNGALTLGGLKRFDEGWNKQTFEDQFAPSQKVFRRLDSGAELVENTLGNTAPPHVKMALKVARHVGSIGGPAHRILAPTMDRAAYRYRGTERPVDQALTEAAAQDRDTVIRRSGDEDELRRIAAGQRQDAKAALQRAQREHVRAKAQLTEAFEHARLTGDRKAQKRAHNDLYVAGQKLADATVAFDAAGDQVKLREERGDDIRRQTHVDTMRRGFETKNGVWHSSQVLEYLAARVPKPELAELQLKSGVVPPSEGVIIGGDGTIKTQTVGYGDDHFLPFTLKNLAGLKGGYYVRTRTFGGPTSEDIYTGLVSGAKALTVVSNNGVFTIDFDHDLKGGRRFNDKAARMVGRYGHLLDAVKWRKVPGADIDPARAREIHQQAAGEAPGNAGQQAARVKELTAREKENPTLSRAQKQSIAGQYLNDVMLTNGWHDGRSLTMDQLAEFAANRQATEQARSAAAPYGGKPLDSGSRARALKAEWMADPNTLPEHVAEALHARTGLEQALGKELDNVRRSMQPLRLDGHGYDFAMQALQEQFPYYIRDTAWRQRQNVVDRDDTGYVKPGRNRPADALAGYYDPTIAGRPGGAAATSAYGKVAADTVRQQGRIAHPVAAQVGGDAPAVAQVAGAAAAAATPAAAAQNPQQARNAADRAMLKHLLELRDRPVGARFGNGAWASVAAKPITQLLHHPIYTDDAGVDHTAAIKAIFQPAPAEVLGDQLRDTEGKMHAPIAAASKWLQDHGAYEGQWNGQVVRNFQAGGKAQEITKLTSADVIPALRDPDRDWDFSGSSPVFMPGTTADKEAIHKAYEDQPAIKALVSEGLLPGTLGDGAAFKAKAAAAAKQIEAEDNAARAWDLDGVPPQPAFNSQQATQRGMALVAARQLQRRYQEAVSKEFQVIEERRLAHAKAQPDTEVNILGVTVDPNGQVKAIDAPADQQIPPAVQALIDAGLMGPPR